MKKTAAKQQQNEWMLWGVLGAVVLGCAIWTYMEFASPSTPAPPAAPVITESSAAVTTRASATPASRPAAGVKENAARNLGSIGQYDPTLHMASMEVTEALEYSGSGRNIFSATSAPPPVAIPMPTASARTAAAAPIAPVRPMPTGPPPPPPIDLKFFGTETNSKGLRLAFLLHGDDVYLASDGEVVGRRYKVVTVNANSIVVLDMPNNNQQTLPLEAQ